jgi:hypothetical protein
MVKVDGNFYDANSVNEDDDDNDDDGGGGGGGKGLQHT